MIGSLPFVRIFRDKRGYEYFSLVHTTSPRRGKVQQRVLYWFRTPPNVRVGRVPFDEETMRAIEARHPGVTFDWDALRNTPMPAPVEPWRERRRIERAARQFRNAEEEPEADAGAPQGDTPPARVERPLPPDPARAQPPAIADQLNTESQSPDPAAQPMLARVADPRRRRRRRGGRARAAGQAGNGGGGADLPAADGRPSSMEQDHAAPSSDINAPDPGHGGSDSDDQSE